MMSLLRIILPIYIIIIYGGCFGSSPKPPSWYGKSSTNETQLIGFGNANSLNTAQANALSDIITQINVQVSTQFSSNIKRQNNLITHNSSNEVYLDSAGIELNDVQYSRSAFENGIFYVEAKVHKATLIKQFQKKFNTVYNSLNLSRITQCNTISIKDKIQIEKNLETLHLYATLLQTLGTTSKPLNNFENILAANTPQPNAKLVIESNLTNEIIYNNLAKELGHFYSFDSQANQILKAKVQVSNNNEGVKINIIFAIFDCRNNPIFNTNVSYTHNATNVQEALRFASQRVSVQLYKKIQEWIEQ